MLKWFVETGPVGKISHRIEMKRTAALITLAATNSVQLSAFGLRVGHAADRNGRQLAAEKESIAALLLTLQWTFAWTTLSQTRTAFTPIGTVGNTTDNVKLFLNGRKHQEKNSLNKLHAMVILDMWSEKDETTLECGPAARRMQLMLALLVQKWSTQALTGQRRRLSYTSMTK